MKCLHATVPPAMPQMQVQSDGLFIDRSMKTDWVGTEKEGALPLQRTMKGVIVFRVVERGRTRSLGSFLLQRIEQKFLFPFFVRAFEFSLG